MRRWAPLDALTARRADARSGWEGFEDRILYEMILHAIQRALTEDQRHVIILRFLEGFNLREIAAILGRDVSHIKVIQNRAIAKLRKVFESKESRTVVSLPRIGQLSKVLGI